MCVGGGGWKERDGKEGKGERQVSFLRLQNGRLMKEDLVSVDSTGVGTGKVPWVPFRFSLDGPVSGRQKVLF